MAFGRQLRPGEGLRTPLRSRTLEGSSPWKEETNDRGLGPPRIFLNLQNIYLFKSKFSAPIQMAYKYTETSIIDTKIS